MEKLDDEMKEISALHELMKNAEKRCKDYGVSEEATTRLLLELMNSRDYQQAQKMFEEFFQVTVHYITHSNHTIIKPVYRDHPKRFVVGDIHGNLRGLKQVLGEVNFQYGFDTLIGIGDYVDGWPDSKEVIDFLISIPKFVGVMGNHDEWVFKYLKYGIAEWNWFRNGGNSSLKSYNDISEDDRYNHIRFFENLHYKLEIDDKLFVHGGCEISPSYKVIPFENNFHTVWDRSLFNRATAVTSPSLPPLNLEPYKEIYIGHTTTEMLTDPDKKFVPFINEDGVICIDQGGGWSGKLTLMDIDTKEYVVSDFTYNLYPEVKGRRG